MNAPSRSVGRASAVGVLWNGLAFSSGKVVVFVTTVVLARLLEPSDFGLLAIGLVVIGYLDFVNDFGISSAFIQDDGDADVTANVAFWINIALGVAMGVVGFVSAPLLSSFFDEPRATDIVRVLSLSFPLTSLGSIHEARLRRELRFGRRLAPELAKGVAKGAVSITMAATGFGVWSLVWGQLAGAFVASVAYWAVTRWIPTRQFDRQVARRLVGFGSQMTLVGLLGGLHKNVDYLVVGRSLGTRQLGIYSIAFRLPQLLIESVVDIAGQVAFPAFSRVRREPDRVRAGLRRMLMMVGIIIVPLGLGLALTAEPFVEIFYGSRWSDAAVVMQILSLYMLIQSLSKTCGDVYKAMGRPSILNKLALVKLAVTIPLLVLAAPRGIVAVAVAQLIAAGILTIVRLVLAARVVGSPLRDVTAPFIPSIRSGGLMTIVCVPCIIWLDGVAPILEMFIITTVGSIVYLATLWLFDRAELISIARLTRRPGADGGRKGVRVADR